MSQTSENDLNSVFEVERVRQDFPILSRKMGKRDLIYFDNAASLQRSKTVLEKTKEFSETSYANVHRALHRLGQESTEAYEQARKHLADFIGCEDSKELIFTSGATASINLVMRGYAFDRIEEGDEILVTRMEHHANWVPWLWLAQQKKAVLKVAELDESFRIDWDDFKSKLTPKTKVVALSAASNVLGVVNPIHELAELAKSQGAAVVVDGAQALSHGIQGLLDAPIDFLACSSHKIGGPGGVGFLWASLDRLVEMSPVQFGGEMIDSVSETRVTWNEIPYKFEAGTPAIVEAIGFAEASRYLESLGLKNIKEYESALGAYALERLVKIEGLKLLGPMSLEDRLPIYSFHLEGVNNQDLAQYLDSKGVCVRTGLHCAEPLHQKFGFESTARISLSFYNRFDEVDFVIEALKRAKGFFGS